MAINIPKVVTSLIVNNDPTQRLLNGLTNAVNPLVAFVNATFQTLADGSLSIQRSVSVQGNASVSGTQNVTGLSTVNNQNVQGNSNVAGNSNITGNSTVTGNTVSATGFKSTFDMGICWSSAATAGTRYQTKRFTTNDAASATFNSPTLFQPIFSGSIVGIHMYSQGTAGGTFFTQVYKSNTLVAAGTTPLITTGSFTASPQYVGYNANFAKGTYPFNAMDYFTTACTFNTAGNQLVSVTLYVEYGA